MTGSSAPLRRLGAELRRLREAAGRTQVDVGNAIGRSHATLVNWERGRTKISKSDLVCLLTELRAPRQIRQGLEQLWAESRRGLGEWAIYGLPDWLRPLVSFEEDAVEVWTFEPAVVPGLLQTEAYARAIHLAGPVPEQETVENWVAARMQRQRRMSGPRPLVFRTVISEAAVRLRVGGPSVLAAQLERICQVAQHRNVSVQVLPLAAGAHPALAGNFTVLHFADPASDPPLGYFDGPLGGYLVSDRGDVGSLADMFEEVRRKALGKAASLDLVVRILEEIRREGREDD